MRPTSGRQPVTLSYYEIMQIQFKYVRAGELHEGAINVAAAQDDHHEIVRAVVQHVANEVGETIAFRMMDPAGTVPVGTNVIAPEGIESSEARTVESIEIAQPEGDWGRLNIVA